MSGHTKGRLRISRDGWCVQTVDNQVNIASFLITTPGCTAAEKTANQRRIVALWNAAEELGLTTEAIEAGAIQAAFNEPLVILQDGPTRADAIRALTKECSK